MKMKAAKLTILFFGLNFISSCASLDEDVAIENDDIVIKRIDSSLAYIGVVNVENTTSGALIRGKIRRKRPGRADIPGHLDIQITKPDSTLQYKDAVGYMRINRKSAYARFSLAIDTTLSKGSVVQIRHHEATGGVH